VPGTHTLSISTACGNVSEYRTLYLKAPDGYVFSSVLFASFGLPTGTCGNYQKTPTCDFTNSTSVVSALCIGKSSCSINSIKALFGFDPCPKVVKALAVSLGYQPAIYCMFNMFRIVHIFPYTSALFFLNQSRFLLCPRPLDRPLFRLLPVSWDVFCILDLHSESLLLFQCPRRELSQVCPKLNR